MKILMLDVYPQVNYRVCKDNNGGFGTGNDLGDTFVSKILKSYLKKSVDFPPLFFVSVMGQLRGNGNEIKYSREISDEKFDLCVLASSIVAHETELAAVSKLKDLGIPTLVVGPFATSVPEPYIKNGGKVVIGEPEFYFFDFKLNKSEIQNLPDKIVFNHFFSLDDLYYPAWDLIFQYKKPKFNLLSKGYTIPIQATRGCPYSCSYYCTYPLQQGKKLRTRNTDEVLKEMLFWEKKLSVRNFQFRDPVFTINRKYTNELCDKIINSNHKFNLVAEFHLKDVDYELALKLKKAGLKIAFVGIESSSSEVLLNAKRTTIANDQQAKKISLLEKVGIKVKAMYIFGLPNDDQTTIINTINYALKLNTFFAQFSVFTPYPGTPAYNDYKDKLNNNNYEKYNQWNLVFKHKNLSSKEIRKFLGVAYSKYYTNLKWFLKHNIKLLT
ncbi:B12-binding domain-containing radical SAM protein [Pseudomonadota bacterium]|nr:B12-binding domain-containing radical SAM protein [Pseudomonadota bacterium]